MATTFVWCCQGLLLWFLHIHLFVHLLDSSLESAGGSFISGRHVWQILKFVSGGVLLIGCRGIGPVFCCFATCFVWCCGNRCTRTEVIISFRRIMLLLLLWLQLDVTTYGSREQGLFLDNPINEINLFDLGDYTSPSDCLLLITTTIIASSHHVTKRIHASNLRNNGTFLCCGLDRIGCLSKMTPLFIWLVCRSLVGH